MTTASGHSRRALVIGIATSGISAGQTLLIPLAMWLILAFGWRATYGVMGVAVVVVILPLAFWVVRESPEAMGLTQDGLPAEAALANAVRYERTDVAAAVQTLSFWQLAGGLFTCGFSMSLLSAHGVPMLTDHGFAPMLASWAIAVLGGSSVAFAMVLGAVSDRVGRRPVLAWLYGTRALLFIILFSIRDNPALLLLVAALGGLSMSGSLAMTSALTAEIFGRFSVGSVFGTIFLVHQAGAALGSWLGGYLFETTHGYGAAFAMAAAILCIGTMLSLTIDERAAMPRLSPVAGGR
jgi:MFS family permease